MKQFLVLLAALMLIGVNATAQIPDADGFQLPFNGEPTQSCEFGIFGACYYPDQYHLAEDYDVGVNAPVYACANGIVREAQSHGGYGGTVLIEHRLPSGEYVVSLYAHLFASTLAVDPGQEVVRGQTLIGYIADTEHNGGYAVHFHFAFSFRNTQE